MQCAKCGAEIAASPDPDFLAADYARVVRELEEARQQQSATGEILGIISRSPSDLQPVLDTVAESAARLCEALDATIYRVDGDRLRLVAHHGSIPSGQVREFTVPVSRGNVNGRTVLDQRIVHVADAQTEMEEFPVSSQYACRFGVRTSLSVPLMREGVAIGTIHLRRAEVQLFTERQVALLQTFANQSVIAIENARLFNDTKEALERQTATADILKVISSAPADMQAVFDAIVQSGLKLFSGAAISIALPDGDRVKAAAVAEFDSARACAWRSVFPFPLTREYMHSACILDRRVIDFPDVRDAPSEFAAGSENFLKSGYRAVTVMPLVRGDVAIGAISVVRMAPGPLSDKQVSLLKTFADQAVIAINNTQLFDDLQARRRELQESLEYQTATSAVLNVISRSPSQLQPVLDTIVEIAGRLCNSENAFIFKLDDDKFRLVATNCANKEQVEAGTLCGHARSSG
jgi:GAF domain-containing protein